MNITYKTLSYTLTPDIQSYTEEKLTSIRKLLAHHDEENISCDVTMSHDSKHHSGMIYRADFTVFAGPERVHGVGHGISMQAALDAAKDETLRRMRAGKEVHVRLMRKGGAMIKRLLRQER